MENDTYRVCLFGHRDFNGYSILDDRLVKLFEDIIDKKSFVEIYIGRNGEFDIYAASVIKRARRITDKRNNELICVLPYQVKNIDYYERYYDSVIIPENVIGVYPKSSITIRNRWIIENCDLVICYVEREEGGAYSAMKYAQKLNKKIINLATAK